MADQVGEGQRLVSPGGQLHGPLDQPVAVHLRGGVGFLGDLHLHAVLEGDRDPVRDHRGDRVGPQVSQLQRHRPGQGLAAGDGSAPVRHLVDLALHPDLLVLAQGDLEGRAPSGLGKRRVAQQVAALEDPRLTSQQGRLAVLLQQRVQVGRLFDGRRHPVLEASGQLQAQERNAAGHAVGGDVHGTCAQHGVVEAPGLSRGVESGPVHGRARRGRHDDRRGRDDALAVGWRAEQAADEVSARGRRGRWLVGGDGGGLGVAAAVSPDRSDRDCGAASAPPVGSGLGRRCRGRGPSART